MIHAGQVDVLRFNSRVMAYFQTQFPNNVSLKVKPTDENTRFELVRDPRNKAGIVVGIFIHLTLA